MRIDKNDVIAGLPATDARAVVRLFYNEHHAEHASRIVPPEDAEAAVLALAEAGFLAVAFQHNGENFWETTINGNALAQASFGKPISRATADRLVSGLLERSRSFNADPAKVLSVGRVRLFGSYLDAGVAKLGDVDVELTTVRRLAGQDYMDAAQAYTKASGRSFNTYVDQLFWPERELIQFLKHKSTALNITTEDVTQFTDAVRTVYTIGDDPQALPVADVEEH